jgi:hypothetical protein
VRAHLDAIEREAPEAIVHRLDHRASDQAVSDVGLVGDDDDEPTRAAERLHGLRRAWQEPELGEGAGRIRLAAADNCAADDSVAVEEDRRPAGRRLRLRFGRWPWLASHRQGRTLP